MQYSPEKNTLPIGTQSFEVLRRGNSVYVDKTSHIHNLLSSGRVYFLSRPRRFGKSLLISTLEAVFSARRDLFDDTWIANNNYDWPTHPVIRIDMVDVTHNNDVKGFKSTLKRRLVEIVDEYKIKNMPVEYDEATCFSYLIKNLSKINSVAVLIDEYDKPILDNISDPQLANAMRNVLRQFYSILKAQDENIRFVLLTGVTNFSKVSVFSGLNNLQDISMTQKYSSLCGYTQVELEEIFPLWIKNLARSEGTSTAEQLDKIKSWYNGYRFSEVGEQVYNPFSTLVLFEHHEYKPYWFDTGTPKFLYDLIKDQELALQTLNHLVV